MPATDVSIAGVGFLDADCVRWMLRLPLITVQHPINLGAYSLLCIPGHRTRRPRDGTNRADTAIGASVALFLLA